MPQDLSYITKTPEDGCYEVEKNITEHLNGDEQDHRFAFSDTGYILLVPADTKVDDLVCHFKSCNVIAIIREHTSREKSGGIVIGRAGRYHVPGRLEDEEVNPLTPDFPVELTLNMRNASLLAACAPSLVLYWEEIVKNVSILQLEST